MAALAKNNAFGLDSPSWNLTFPDGNLTAVEILTYLPHWLKSIDVIDRFVANGGKSRSIAFIINEFREQPTGAVFSANSAQIMMSYAMRRAGYEEWTVGTHDEWPRAMNSKENNLSVRGFRPPRITHPKRLLKSQKKTREVARNEVPAPVAFKDLVLYVKEHPTGADALDLSRCVKYAMKHADEEWWFPDDFTRLTIHLGGPAPVTHSHLDRQIFARREALFPSPPRGVVTNRAPRVKNMPTPRITRAIEDAVARSQSGTPIPTPSLTPSLTPTHTPKRKATSKSFVRMATGDKRRSSRLEGKKINFREDSDGEGADDDFLEQSNWNEHTSPAKKRKLSRIPPPPASPINESDFIDDASEPDEEIPEAEVASDEEVPAYTPRSQRIAAHKARNSIQTAFVSASPLAKSVTKIKVKAPLPSARPAYMSAVVDPKLMDVVKAYAHRQPVWLNPPILSDNRIKIDAFSIRLYASDDCATEADMWRTAFSCYRFRGPRRHSPFRELYRLTDPDQKDTSDWAENIRWAKEQYRAFDSKTWTEYDYHLDSITEHRREGMWVSEEMIKAGM